MPRIGPLGARLLRLPAPHHVPSLVARIVRLWGALRAVDPELAAELIEALPQAQIEIVSREIASEIDEYD